VTAIHLALDDNYFIVPSQRLKMCHKALGQHSEKRFLMTLAVGTCIFWIPFWTQIGCDEGRKEASMLELQCTL